MALKANVPAGSISRTSAGLREMLFQQIEGIKAGDIDPLQGAAVAKLAREIILSVRLELDVADRMERAGKTSPPDLKPINLVIGIDVVSAPAQNEEDSRPVSPSISKTRSCLKCATPFPSEGAGNRICPRCSPTVSNSSPLAVGV